MAVPVAIDDPSDADVHRNALFEKRATLQDNLEDGGEGRSSTRPDSLAGSVHPEPASLLTSISFVLSGRPVPTYS